MSIRVSSVKKPPRYVPPVTTKKTEQTKGKSSPVTQKVTSTASSLFWSPLTAAYNAASWIANSVYALPKMAVVCLAGAASNTTTSALHGLSWAMRGIASFPVKTVTTLSQAAVDTKNKISGLFFKTAAPLEKQTAQEKPSVRYQPPVYYTNKKPTDPAVPVENKETEKKPSVRYQPSGYTRKTPTTHQATITTPPTQQVQKMGFLSTVTQKVQAVVNTLFSVPVTAFVNTTRKIATLPVRTVRAVSHGAASAKHATWAFFAQSIPQMSKSTVNAGVNGVRRIVSITANSVKKVARFVAMIPSTIYTKAVKPAAYKTAGAFNTVFNRVVSPIGRHTLNAAKTVVSTPRNVFEKVLRPAVVWNYTNVIKPAARKTQAVAKALFVTVPVAIVTAAASTTSKVVQGTYSQVLAPAARMTKNAAVRVANAPKAAYEGIFRPTAVWTANSVLKPLSSKVVQCTYALFISLPRKTAGFVASVVTNYVALPVAFAVKAVAKALFISLPSGVNRMVLRPTAQGVCTAASALLSAAHTIVVKPIIMAARATAQINWKAPITAAGYVAEKVGSCVHALFWTVESVVVFGVVVPVLRTSALLSKAIIHLHTKAMRSLASAQKELNSTASA